MRAISSLRTQPGRITQPRLRTWLGWLSLLLVAPFVTCLAVLLDVYRVAEQDSAAPAEAAVVLGAAQWNGAPSPVFQSRLDYAAQLWRDGRVRWIIVTGGTAQGDSTSEAEVGVGYLTSRGIPSPVLLAAPGGSTTLVSIQAAASAMDAHRLHSALLVSEPYHMKRTLRMAEDRRLNAAAAPVRGGPFADAPLAVLRQSARETVGYSLYVLVGI